MNLARNLFRIHIILCLAFGAVLWFGAKELSELAHTSDFYKVRVEIVE